MHFSPAALPLLVLLRCVSTSSLGTSGTSHAKVVRSVVSYKQEKYHSTKA